MGSTMDLIGYVTSAWFSPTQGCNIAMAMLPVEYAKLGTKLGVALPNRYKENDVDPAEVCGTPFKAPPSPFSVNLVAMFVSFSIKREPPLRSKLLLGSGGDGACGDRLKNYLVVRPFGVEFKECRTLAHGYLINCLVNL